MIDARASSDRLTAKQDVCRSSGTFNAVGRKSKRRPDRQKLIIILVGLPGRGKTFLCNKLICYLNWCAVLVSAPVCASRLRAAISSTYTTSRNAYSYLAGITFK